MNSIHCTSWSSEIFFFGESLLSIFRTDLFLKNGSIHLIIQDIFCFVNSGIFSLKSRYLRKMRFTQISLRRIFSWPVNLYLVLPLVKTFSLCSHSASFLIKPEKNVVYYCYELCTITQLKQSFNIMKCKHSNPFKL